MSDIEYVSIDRDELKRLQADSEELANLLAAQQQAEPVAASRDEEGLEVIERYALGGHCDSFGQDCGAEMERDEDGEYMTVAQHSRIVAAKDAALCELINSRNCYQWEFERVSAELEQLSAQPARQVGGEGSAAQKSFWAGFEAASMSKSSNIREAWNQYKATDEFARLNRRAIPEELLRRVIRSCHPDHGDELRALLGKS